jgi:hypothetical protein
MDFLRNKKEKKREKMKSSLLISGKQGGFPLSSERRGVRDEV